MKNILQTNSIVSIEYVSKEFAILESRVDFFYIWHLIPFFCGTQHTMLCNVFDEKKIHFNLSYCFGSPPPHI